ncbi:hypothetical protein MMC13_005957 [Lambiella insularis]|nr:hypothetical protein [Lambiella insularis]
MSYRYGDSHGNPYDNFYDNPYDRLPSRTKEAQYPPGVQSREFSRSQASHDYTRSTGAGTSSYRAPVTKTSSPSSFDQYYRVYEDAKVNKAAGYTARAAESSSLGYHDYVADRERHFRDGLAARAPTSDTYRYANHTNERYDGLQPGSRDPVGYDQGLSRSRSTPRKSSYR